MQILIPHSWQTEALGVNANLFKQALCVTPGMLKFETLTLEFCLKVFI